MKNSDTVSIVVWLIIITVCLYALQNEIDKKQNKPIPPKDSGIKSEFGPIDTRPTMDNYSFSVGVWCAWRVIKPNGLSSTEWTHEESQLLHDARHFSITNGWLPFSDREGFRGDE